MKKDSLFESAWQGPFYLNEKFFRIKAIASAEFHAFASDKEQAN